QKNTRGGAAAGAVGFVLAAAAGDPPVAFAEEGVGSGGADGGFAEDPGQVAVVVPGGALAFLLPGRFLDPGRVFGPGRQVAWGGEAGHVGTDLGDHTRG